MYNYYGGVMKKRRLKKSVKQKILYFFLLITIGVIIFCITKILFWANDNKKTGEMIDTINDQVKINTSDEEIVNIEESIEKDDPYWSYNSSLVKNVDLTKLMEINNETVGWIAIQNSTVNYPVVQHSDNDYYLNHSFDRSINGAGWVFMDYRNNYKDIDDNTIMYAHGRLDYTMFGALKKFLNESWIDNPQNYVMNFSNNNYNSLWQIFSVYKIETTSDYLTINFNDPNERLNFYNMLKDRSIYDFKTTLSDTNKIMTLSTCYNDSEKLVVHAKLIKIQYKNQ